MVSAMGRPAADILISRRVQGLLGTAVMLLILGGAAMPARAQRVALEADSKALTKLFRKQIGTRWVLLKWHGTERLVFENPKLSITPLGLYVAGTLRSTAPVFSTAVEVRVRPRVKGSRIEIVPGAVLVTRPAGVWGIIPRRILKQWLNGAEGKKWLSQAQLDLSPLLAILGKPKKYTIGLKLGFGRLTLTVQL